MRSKSSSSKTKRGTAAILHLYGCVEGRATFSSPTLCCLSGAPSVVPRRCQRSSDSHLEVPPEIRTQLFHCQKDRDKYQTYVIYLSNNIFTLTRYNVKLQYRTLTSRHDITVPSDITDIMLRCHAFQNTMRRAKLRCHYDVMP